MASPRVLPPDPEDDELRGPINSLGRYASRLGLAAAAKPGAPARDANGGPLLVERPVRDAAEAVARLRAADAQGHPSAAWLLGEAHETGEGVGEPDLAAAVAFYRRAADRGSEPAAQALRRLGVRWYPKRRPEEPVEAEEPVPPRYVRPPYADAFVPGAEALGSKHMSGKESH